MIRKSIFMGLFLFPTLAPSLQAQSTQLTAMGHCPDSNSRGPNIGKIVFGAGVAAYSGGQTTRFISAKLISSSAPNKLGVVCTYDDGTESIGRFSSTKPCFFNGNPGQLECKPPSFSTSDCKVTCQ